MQSKKLILGTLGISGLIYLLTKVKAAPEEPEEPEEPGFQGELLDDCDGFGPYDPFAEIWRWIPVRAASDPELSTNRLQGEYSIAMGKYKTDDRGNYYYHQNFGEGFSLRGKDLYVCFYIEDLDSLNLMEDGDWAIRFCFGFQAIGSGEKGPFSFMCGGLSLDYLRQFQFPGWVNLTIRIPQTYGYIDNCHFIGFGFWTKEENDLIPTGSILMDNWRIIPIEE